MNASEVIEHLKMSFPSPAFAFLEQVADGTGSRQHRWADAVAMSVWPSRGYDIHGVEVKVSKYDWKSELKKPEKSVAVQQYCNRWWIATPDESIIEEGELPPTWGWMVCKGKGMRVVVPAPALTPKAPSVEFVASVLRNIQRADETATERLIHAAYNKGREEGGGYLREKVKNLQQTFEEFEKASGIRLSEYSGGKDLGEAVQTLTHLKYRIQNIEQAVRSCEDIRGMLIQVQSLATLREEVQNESR